MKLFALVLVALLFAGCSSTAREPSVLLPFSSDASWGIVNATSDVDFVVSLDVNGTSNLWLGMGRWTFSAPDAWAAPGMYVDFLAAHNASNHARVLHTTGFPLRIRAAASVDDAENSSGGSWLVTQVTSTYTVTQMFPDRSVSVGAYRVDVGLPLSSFVVSVPSGKVSVQNGSAWEPIGDHGKARLASVHVIVEEACGDTMSEAGAVYACPALATRQTAAVVGAKSPA